MLFEIENLVVLSLVTLLFYLIHKTTNNNKYHLKYLKLHLSTIITSASIYVAIKNQWVPNARFDVIIGLHMTGIIFLLLHVESAVIGFRAKFKVLYLIPIGIYCLVCLLNYFDIYLLNFSTRQISTMGVKILQPRYFSDKLFIRSIFLLLIIYFIFIRFKKNIHTSQEINQKKTYTFWLYSYLCILLTSVILLALYYFGFLDPNYDANLKILSRAFITLSVISFSINPSILYYFPLITKNNIYKCNISLEHFKIIEQLMQEEQLFLDKTLSLNGVCERTGLNQKLITTTIKKNTEGNWKGYLNSYRIRYALNLLNSSYLKRHSIISLGQKSGFNSNQSFFRAFKNQTNTTPGKYFKTIIKKELELIAKENLEIKVPLELRNKILEKHQNKIQP